MKALILKQTENYESLIGLRHITTETHFDGNPKVVMDKDLADILIDNLIKNAVRHNIENGFIRIWLTDKTLIIKNSGIDPKMPTGELFEQFSRGSDKGFMGIGLAIVKKIVEHYHLQIQYDFNEGIHKIRINF